MSALSIRPVRATDIGSITRIYAHAVCHGTASFELEPPDETEMMRRHDVLAARNCPYLVAEADNEIAGYAYAGPYHTRPGYRWTLEDSIYLAPHRQGRGIGRALLARLIDDAEQLGFRQMVAVIGDSQNVASIALHARLGFRHVGTLGSVGFKFGRWLDSVLMQRALGRGADGAP